jgi:hypothetical protein
VNGLYSQIVKKLRFAVRVFETSGHLVLTSIVVTADSVTSTRQIIRREISAERSTSGAFACFKSSVGILHLWIFLSKNTVNVGI